MKVNEKKVLATIKDAESIKPDFLELKPTKWKLLVRTGERGKNACMIGPSGCGKTQSAYALAEATKKNKKFFVFNMGACQDPRSFLIGNTHFKNGETVFDKSPFIQAITTPNAIVLLDEINRPHPDAWNILMSVLDEKQRYVRVDEDINSPKIDVAEGVCFIATANVGSEYTATKTLDRAIKDRFQLIEVDALSKEGEADLLTKRFPEMDQKVINAIADIAHRTREEWRKEDSKISTMVSSRMSITVCELINDGFTLGEAADVAILPFFDASGGIDSERHLVFQIVEKHLDASEKVNIFNVVEEDEVKDS